ncbi:outer membrane beta-barrel protein [Azospirillum halopraeferens]|uniref:outer membrane beta-barrel protein n=1 Tax=Azospirillum halopraeferens TaxID=34010 RepID=UPI0004292E32|nr:outer membrane beta-barrel protein [Azospirillum halopraeferens]
MKKTAPLSIRALAAATTGVAGALAAGLVAAPVAAQDLLRGETVLERPRPEVEQLGMRAGSFLVMPRLEAGATYDSNVFATERNTRDDIIAVIRPELDVRSNWNRHALNLSAYGELGRYRDHSRLNYDDYRLVLDGRADVWRENTLEGRLFHRRSHEGAGDVDTQLDPTLTVGVVEPVVYRVSGGELAYTQHFNRVRARLSGLASYYDYDDAKLAGGRTSPEDDRNRWSYGTALRVGYSFSEGYEGFVQGAYTWTRYDDSTKYGGIDRDSKGYDIGAGVAADLTGLITGEAFVGYLRREFDSAALGDVDGLAFGGRLNWAVTELTAVTGTVSRHVRETRAAQGARSASSYTRTVYALGVDHELLRTVMLNGRLQYRTDDFNGIDRFDEVYTAGVGATYQVNRYLYVTGGYTFETRESDTAAGYDDNLFFLRLGAQL